MKKNLKKLGIVVSIMVSMVFTTACGDKKIDQKAVDAMVDKYSAYCTLGEYKGVEYEEVKTEITDEDVQYQVDSLLERYATSTEITTGTVADGDTVNIDYAGRIEGELFDGGSAQGTELILGSGMFIPGFEEQIMGHEIGETFDINVEFPEDYTAELAGKVAVFTITLNSKVEKTYPEYNDDFVAANTDQKTVAEYEEFILNTMNENAAESDANYNKSAVMTAVIEASTVNEYPQKESEELIDETVKQVEVMAESSGYDLQTYVTVVYGMSSVDAFREYVGEIVKSYMTEKIVVCAIDKAEKITVTDEEIAAYKVTMMEDLGITDEEVFYENYTDEDVAYYALAENVVEYILENATPVEATTTEAAQ